MKMITSNYMVSQLERKNAVNILLLRLTPLCPLWHFFSEYNPLLRHQNYTGYNFQRHSPPRSSSLSLASTHSICTRENSLERGGGSTYSCPTSPTKIPLSSDSPLLSKVSSGKITQTNSAHRFTSAFPSLSFNCRGYWTQRYNV